MIKAIKNQENNWENTSSDEGVDFDDVKYEKLPAKKKCHPLW